MKDSTHGVREELRGVLIFLAIIWTVFLLNYVVPIDFNRFGLVPRSFFGAIGIPLMPFLHANLGHLLGNSIPLFVLLTLLAGSRSRSWETVGEIVFVGGVLLWVFGRENIHVGASGLVFGLIVFLILSGFLEGRIIPLIISVAVALLYGGTLFWGVLPTAGSQVSWDGHLCGAVAGGLNAVFLAKAPTDGEEAPQ